MTNGQINCFLTVVDEGSFAKAASALFISQPAISKSISKMEEELGIPLLERKVGSLNPTRAGNILYHFLKRSRNEYENLIQEIQNMESEPSGTVRLGCPDTWNPGIFYNKITGHFAKHYPSVKLELECHRLPALMSKLQSGKVDIIMSHEFYPPVQYGLTVRRLTTTGCGIVYARNFFSGIESLSDLRDTDFLYFDSDIEKKFGSVLKKYCADYGFTPNLKNCGQYASTMFSLSCGKGVMFFTDWDNAVFNSTYSYLPLNYSSPVNIIYPSVTTNSKVHLFAEELIKLYAAGESTEE